MNLVMANSKDIIVGKYLPWALYDRERNLLLGQGDIVRDDQHRDTLLASSACYELLLEAPPANRDVPDSDDNFFAAEEVSLDQPENKETRQSYTFDDMKLKVGDRLNIELPVEYDFRIKRQPPNERFLVKVIGFLKGVSLLVTAPNIADAQIMAGKKIIIRSFSGQNAFGFSCTIERICKEPFKYLHLTFPDIIEGIVVRKAPRVKTRIIASVQDGKSGAEAQISALISDISANGASLDAKQPLGDKGDVLNMTFRVPLHNIDAQLSVKGAIRAMFSGDAADTSKSSLIRHGIEFQGMQPNDCVILQSMVYQQMIENPHKLV